MAVINSKTGEYFRSARAAAQHYGLKESSIKRQIKGILKTTENGMRFREIEDRKPKKRKKTRPDSRKRVKCPATNRYFPTVRAAANYAGVSLVKFTNHIKRAEPTFLHGRIYCYGFDRILKPVINLETGRDFYTLETIANFCDAETLEQVEAHLRGETPHINSRSFWYAHKPHPTLRFNGTDRIDVAHRLTREPYTSLIQNMKHISHIDLFGPLEY